MIQRNLMNHVAQLSSQASQVSADPEVVGEMKQDETICNTFELLEPTQRELSARQVKALSLFLLGATDKIVSRELGVSRTTLWRWNNRDPRFMAERNRYTDQVASTTAARMNQLMSQALGIVAQQMNSKMAIESFRAASLMVRIGAKRLPPLPTMQQLDPEQIAAALVKAGVDFRDLEQPEEQSNESAG